MKTPLPLSIYRGIARWPGPWLARRLLERRAAIGKEDAGRLPERFGAAGRDRPAGAVVWLHGASVGECLSLLPLIRALAERRPDLTVLVTSGTVTSARMMETHLPDGAIHQFAPVDTVDAVGRFLEHWRPAMLCVVESEIWPTMLSEARKRGVRTAMISARLSSRSVRGWRYAPRTIAALLGQFDLILAQNETAASRLREVGAPAERLSVTGSLKQTAAPLPVDEAELAGWRERLRGRCLWLAASTHDGEEQAAIEAGKALRRRAPGTLTIIAPRHPERGDAVARLGAASGERLARRSLGETVDAETGIYLVDVLGELGLWFRLAPVVFLGGSLTPGVGGHNPLEPARLGATVCYGPHIESVVEECDRLEAHGAARRLAMAPDASPGLALATALEELIDETGRPSLAARDMGAAAARLTLGDGGVLERIMAALAPLLPAEGAPAAARANGDAGA